MDREVGSTEFVLLVKAEAEDLGDETVDNKAGCQGVDNGEQAAGQLRHKADAAESAEAFVTEDAG